MQQLGNTEKRNYLCRRVRASKLAVTINILGTRFAPFLQEQTTEYKSQMMKRTTLLLFAVLITQAA
jgi:hypothetical protein